MVFSPGGAPIASHDPCRRLLVFGMHFVGDGVGSLQPSRVRDPALISGLAHRCETRYRRGDLEGAQLALHDILLMLWEDAQQPSGSADTALEDIVEAIRQDASRRRRVVDLARQAALSRAQFTRRFIAATGMAPARFVIRARIERARQLLSETSLSVTQVASLLGYSDVAYFSRQYKRTTGHSPRSAH